MERERIARGRERDRERRVTRGIAISVEQRDRPRERRPVPGDGRCRLEITEEVGLAGRCRRGPEVDEAVRPELLGRIGREEHEPRPRRRRHPVAVDRDDMVRELRRLPGRRRRRYPDEQDQPGKDRERSPHARASHGRTTARRTATPHGTACSTGLRTLGQLTPVG